MSLKSSLTPILITGSLAVGLAACGSGDSDVSPSDSIVVEESSSSTARPDESLPVAVILDGVPVTNFMYQIQELDDRSNIDDLAATSYDMLVVEPGFNFTESPYDVEYLVDQLSNKPNGDDRILLAYIDIGQAEDYRDYWEDQWVAPVGSEPGSPPFLVTLDPDGWEGNYPVAYWHAEWQDLWLGDQGLINQIAELGFDGVYLDWVEAYDDDFVRAAADREGVSPEDEMMLFVEGIGRVGSEVDTGFLVISQNAPYLLDFDPERYASLIDGLATEDTWYYGAGDAEWESAETGDLTGGDRHEGDYSTKARIEQSRLYLELGIPVFTVDYAADQEHAAEVYNDSLEEGFIPLVTRVSLSRITETPPAWVE